MSFLSRIFGEKREREALLPLYTAIVAAGRDPAWYRDGGVPDTLDGRFDTIAAILSLVLLRMEREGEGARQESVLLTEIFVQDMDGTLRQIGIGDMMVGKHVGKIMGALGGRLGAFRAAFAGERSLEEAVRRNVFRDSPPDEEKVALVSGRLRALHERLEKADLESLLRGELA